MAEHLNQSVDAKAVNLSPHKVTDSRLRHAEELGGVCLRQCLGLNQLRQLNHQIGPDLEILCLVFAKPKIPEDIVAGASSSDTHLLPLSFAAEGLDFSQAFAREGQIAITREL